MCSREKDLTAACIIKMEGNETSITNAKVRPSVPHTHSHTHTHPHPHTLQPLCSPKGPDSITGEVLRERVKTFTYDFSYDSMDRQSSAFVSQEKVKQRLTPAE